MKEQPGPETRSRFNTTSSIMFTMWTGATCKTNALQRTLPVTIVKRKVITVQSVIIKVTEITAGLDVAY